MTLAVNLAAMCVAYYVVLWYQHAIAAAEASAPRGRRRRSIRGC